MRTTVWQADQSYGWTWNCREVMCSCSTTTESCTPALGTASTVQPKTVEQLKRSEEETFGVMCRYVDHGEAGQQRHLLRLWLSLELPSSESWAEGLRLAWLKEADRLRMLGYMIWAKITQSV